MIIAHYTAHVNRLIVKTYYNKYSIVILRCHLQISVEKTNNSTIKNSLNKGR